MPIDPNGTPDELFESFVNAQTFKTILHSFDDLCRTLRIDRTIVGYGRRSLYKVLTSKLTSWKSKSLWAKIDKRGAQKEYENGHACSDTKVRQSTSCTSSSHSHITSLDDPRLLDGIISISRSSTESDDVSVCERFHLCTFSYTFFVREVLIFCMKRFCSPQPPQQRPPSPPTPQQCISPYIVA